MSSIVKQGLTFGFTALAVLLSGSGHPALAEDIDIFRVNPEGVAAPNVLFLIDNTANWNSTISDDNGEKVSKRKLEHDALARVFADEKFESRVNVGFMVFSDAQPEGGKLIKAIQPLDSEYREELRAFFAAGINDTSAGVSKSNNASYALALHEAYQMFSGGSPRAGAPDGKANVIQPDSRAFDASGRYLPPSPEACHDYLVIVGNGAPDNGENSGSTPERLLAELGGNTETIPLNPDRFESIVADEYARFLNNTDIAPDRDGKQNLETYVVHAFDPDSKQAGNSTNQGAEALLKSVAGQTGPAAYYPARSAEELRLALRNILDQVLDLDSVFAATALPVSVNVRGTNLNQIYLGVFRPDAGARTRWQGNLKLLQLETDDGTGDVFIADVNGNPAQNPQSGFIAGGATSFWTHDSLFWAFSPRGTPPSVSDAPDGEVVEKGGAAQKLRELSDSSTPPDGNADTGVEYHELRRIFTCSGKCASDQALSAIDFDTSNPALDASALAVSDASSADDLINWIRGQDLADEDADGLTTDARASLHGDVLHSQPAVVNYGDDGQGVVVFYGANDGMIHAVRGGRDGNQGGQELWAFVPDEFYPRLDNLRRNSVGKRYFADGNLTTHIIDQNGDNIVDASAGDRVLLYASMRRGGRFLYAFDVTNPQEPLFLWQVTAETPGFAELGQTWSEVRVGALKGRNNPVAIFAAGYDPAAEDADPATGLDNSAQATQGRGLFVVDAIDGSLIWQVGPAPDTRGGGASQTEALMQYSMPAAPLPIDRNRDGFLDRIYIPDTGGQVWRVNLNSDAAGGDSNPLLWNAYRLGSVGNDQEFLYSVDAVAAPATALEDAYDAVLVGSGDREEPFDLDTVNHFYMFKDRSDPTRSITKSDLFDATDNRSQQGSDDEQALAATDLANADGWFVRLDNPGEKVVGSATSIAGTTFFNTNQPRSEAIPCAADLGIARSYAVDYRDATSTIDRDGDDEIDKDDRNRELPGGGFPPSPVPYLVEIRGEQYLGIISGLHEEPGPNLQLGVRQRVYWYNDRLDR